MAYVTQAYTIVLDNGSRIPVSEGVRYAIVSLVKHGEKVAAIKLLREQGNLALREAKESCELLYAHAGSPVPFGPQGERL